MSDVSQWKVAHVVLFMPSRRLGSQYFIKAVQLHRRAFQPKTMPDSLPAKRMLDVEKNEYTHVQIPTAAPYKRLKVRDHNVDQMNSSADESIGFVQSDQRPYWSLSHGVAVLAASDSYYLYSTVETMHWDSTISRK